MSWLPEQVESLEAENERLKTQVIIYEQLMDEFIRMYGLCRSTPTDANAGTRKNVSSESSTVLQS